MAPWHQQRWGYHGAFGSQVQWLDQWLNHDDSHYSQLIFGCFHANHGISQGRKAAHLGWSQCSGRKHRFVQLLRNGKIEVRQRGSPGEHPARLAGRRIWLEPWALKKKLRGWDQASWCMDGWDQLSVKFSPVEIQDHQIMYSEVDVGYHIGILPYWSVFLPGHELNLGRSTIKDSWYQPLRDIGGESHHTGDVIVVLVFQSQIHSTAGRLICHVRCASLPMLGYTEENGRYWLRVCLPAFWDLNLSFLMTWGP